jgi:hypothetical protein
VIEIIHYFPCLKVYKWDDDSKVIIPHFCLIDVEGLRRRSETIRGKRKGRRGGRNGIGIRKISGK